MSTRRSLRGGIVAKVAAQVAIAAGTGLISIAVARILGPAAAGSYAVAYTFLTALILLASLGFDLGISYEVGRGRWTPSRAFAESQLLGMGLGLAGALVGFGIFLAARGAFAGLDTELVLITLLALPFGLSWLLASQVALAVDRYELHALPGAAQALLALVLVVPLALLDDLRGALAAWTVSNVAVAIAYALLLRPRLQPDPLLPPPPPGGPRPVVEALRFGSQTYVNNLLQFLNYRVDIFILAAVVGASPEVGHYAVAVTVTTAMWMIPWAISGVLLPRIASLGDDAEASSEVEGRALRHTVLVMVAGSLWLVPLLLWALPVVYGHEFDPSAKLALILLPGVCCFGVGNVLVSATAGRGRPRYAMLNGLLTAPVAITLYVVLIKADGATGAALASTLSYAFSFVLAAIFYRRATGAGLVRALLPTRSEVADYRVAAREMRRVLD